MPATKRKTSPVRHSRRNKRPPALFNPSTTLPTPLQEMIRDVAANAAEKQGVSVDASAMSSLEIALDSVFQRLVSNAYARAQTQGRETITTADIEFVRKQLRK